MARKKKTLTNFTPSRAKHLISLAKVIGPAVVPVVAPYALKAAGVARNSYEHLRARQLGVDVDDLAAFSGKGGKLHARIYGLATALTELRGRDTTPDTVAFITVQEDELAKLTAIVRAAERMPNARRKAAHHTVATELDRLETTLLARLSR